MYIKIAKKKKIMECKKELKKHLIVVKILILKSADVLEGTLNLYKFIKKKQKLIKFI